MHILFTQMKEDEEEYNTEEIVQVRISITEQFYYGYIYCISLKGHLTSTLQLMSL